MKKKIIFCLIFIMMTGVMSGCNKDDRKTGTTNVEAQNTEGGLDDNAENNEENNGEKTYSVEVYGTVEEKQQEYFGKETGNVSYYYRMENFLFNDTVPNTAAINHTLQQIYHEHEESYIETAEEYNLEESPDIPYSYWHILSLEYVGDDYISILYNDIYYMGGAHPYSSYEGITIDCKTGEQVSATQLLGKSDEELLTEISNTMGLDDLGTWDDIDFYLTDSTIVFFYRMPGFCEDVVLQKEELIYAN